MRGAAPTKPRPYRPCRPMKLLILLFLAAVPLASVSRRGEAGLEGGGWWWGGVGVGGCAHACSACRRLRRRQGSARAAFGGLRDLCGLQPRSLARASTPGQGAD